ncbi:hypothetical protein [Sinomonas atrocyanea]
MDEQSDPGDGYLIGTRGASKLTVDGLIDGTAIILSAVIPPGAPLFATGATVIKGIGPMLQEHQERNINLMISEGRKETGLATAEFLGAVTSDPERLLAFVSACDAARRTALDEKVRALGRAAANLARDDALVDDSGIWINIFSQVDAPHVRIMEALCERDPENPGCMRLWKRYELREKCGLTATVSTLINTLTSLGIMREIPYAELSQHDRARWSVGAPGPGYSPVYGKGPLADDFLQRLKSANSDQR